MNDENYTFNFMKENFVLASKQDVEGFKSTHWDVFDENFVKIMKRREVWPRMLRNALTLGLNDGLIKISNKRFAEGNEALWKILKKKQYEDLIFDPEANGSQEKDLISFFHETCALTSTDYVIENCMGDTGMPVCAKFKVKQNNNYKIINCNQHDLDDIFHSWFIINQLQDIPSENPVVCEIGAGYGGVATKIKNNIMGAKIVIFDLPEVNAIQSYYLRKVFPDKIFKGYKDFLELGEPILKEKFDFLILPGWTISQFRKVHIVDAFINIRSFMEMNLNTIKFYLDSIQELLKPNGFFACFNRNEKQLVSPNDNITIRFKDYPFDNNWSVLKSQISAIQPHIHLLITRREKDTQNFNFGSIFENP